MLSTIRILQYIMAGQFHNRRMGIGLILPAGGGAAQAVVDCPPETALRDRHHRDPGETGPVEPAQHRKQIGRRLGKIAGAAQP